MAYKLNLEPWDAMGPMAYNEKRAKHIREHGKELTIENIGIDEEYPECSKEIIVLHKPTNMISTYKGYIYKNHFCIFNGFASPPTDTPLKELLYIPSETETIGESKSFKEEWMDNEFKRLKEEDADDITAKLKLFYLKNIKG